MTAREDLDYFSDAPVYYCKDCAHCEELGELGGVLLMRCRNDASDENEHVFTDSHYACNPDEFREKPKKHGTCKTCGLEGYINDNNLCENCE